MIRLTRCGSLALLVLVSAGTLWAKERPHSFRGAGHFLANQIDFVSDGIATHLGKFTEVGAITAMAPGSEPGVVLVTAWAHHTAANGDVLHEEILAELNFNTGTGTALVTYVNGGSGRFERVSGSAILRLNLAPDGSFTYRGEGVIDY